MLILIWFVLLGMTILITNWKIAQREAIEIQSSGANEDLETEYEPGVATEL